MTALAITAANVKYQEGTLLDGQIAGEAFAAGALLYKKQSDGKMWKAQCDGTAEEAGANGLFMALATADTADAKVSVAGSGAIVQVASSGLTVGIPYFISPTAGSLAPYADLGSTNKVTFAGLSISATKLKLGWLYDAGAILA